MRFVFLWETETVNLSPGRENWVNRALLLQLLSRSDQPDQILSLDHEGAFYMARPTVFGPGDDVKTRLQGRQSVMTAAPQGGGADQPAFLIGRDGGQRIVKTDPMFDLDKGQNQSAARDQIKLADPGSRPLIKDAPPFELQPERTERFAAPTSTFRVASGLCHDRVTRCAHACP
jgi:hypothetical protein